MQKELPGLRGFSPSNIKNMRQFYEEWVDVFENRSAVMSEMGIVPIENSIEGAVGITLDSLANKYDLKIFKEIIIPINQYMFLFSQMPFMISP